MTESTRLHYMDGLRASALVLGIIIHTSVAFTLVDFTPWYIRNNQTHILFNYLFGFIHIFRLPLFFFIAGFFTQHLYQRLGIKQFIVHRSFRIGLPLLICLIVLIPFHWVELFIAMSQQPDMTLMQKIKFFDYTAQFWFLYYLLWFYLLTLLLNVLKPSLLNWISKKFISKTFSFINPIYLAMITMLPLLFAEHWYSETPFSLIPQFSALGFYGIFFFSGWLSNENDRALACAHHYWKVYLFVAVTILFPTCMILHNYETQKQLTFHHALNIAAVYAYSLCAWLMVLGLIGLFKKYHRQHYPIVRYLVDASYWLYLIQVPIIVCLQIILAPLSWPMLIKFFIIFSIAMVVMLLSYRLMVRYTFIGNILNGRVR